MAAPRMAFAGIGFEPAAPARRVPKAAGRILAAIAAAALCAACQREAQAPPAPARPVRTVTVELSRAAPSTSFAGQIEARDEVSLGFRIAGRVLERTVGVGAQVRQGQVVARLDSEDELNALRSARAALAAAQGVLRQAESQYDRQSHLLARGVTSQADYDAAEQARTVARSQVDAAEAQLKISQDVVGFTTLYADAPGIVTAIGAEPGEVVQAGRMIVQLARRDGRDAVFEVPENVLRNSVPDAPITVTLNGDPAATVKGRVREVSPQADPVTRTFRVRVGLTNPGEAFRLGAAVTGTIRPEDVGEVAIPASAIVGTGADTAVWVVEPKTQTVTLRKLQVLRSDPANAIIGKGLEAGDLVVTAGARQLRQGQPVRLIGVES